MRRVPWELFRSTAAFAALTMSLLTATRSFADPPAQPARGETIDPRSTWSGFYIGGHFGYEGGRASSTLLDPGAQSSNSSFGALAGGVQLGYARLLRSRLLLGLEADVSVPSFLDDDDRVSSLTSAHGQLDEKGDCFGAIRVRLGYAFSLGTVYGSGGFAWSLGKFVLNPGADSEAVQRRLRPGWTLGAGFEIPVAANWTARLEYAYDRFEGAGAAFAGGPSTSATVGMHNVRLGLSWQIPWLGGDSRREERVELPPGDSHGVQASNLTARPSEEHDSVGADVSRKGHVALPPGDGPNMPESDPVARPSVERGGVMPGATAWNIHGQATFVGQGYPSFRSPYEGAQSLSGSGQLKNTTSATMFLGLRLWHGAELYFNPELMQGLGLSDTHGVAGFPNGEAQKSGFPVPRFNAARIFVSQTFGFGGEQERVEDGPNQLPGTRDVSRLTITAGKLAVTDLFLVNAVSGEPRTRFLNWNIYGTGAYDWTMDLLSWTWGAMVELNQKSWAFRTGYFLLPRVANTNYFDFHIPSNGQYLAELERRYAPFGKPGKLLLFGWLAHGNIGSYPDALAEPVTTPNYPDVTLTRGRDRFNYGFALSAEQTITDALGVFARASWSPEKGESMGWTDVGEAFTLGGTLKGAWWHRPDDVFGLAGVVEGLSPVTKRFFAAGGRGTIIGDGRLNYRPEMVLETFYAFAPLSWATATLDYQLVVNPGYNADRGPVSIFAVRLHAAF